MRGITYPVIKALGLTISLTCVHILREVIVVYDCKNNSNDNNNQLSVLFTTRQNMFDINDKCV